MSEMLFEILFEILFWILLLLKGASMYTYMCVFEEKEDGCPKGKGRETQKKGVDRD